MSSFRTFRRFLRPEAVKLALATRAVPEGDLPEGFDPGSEKNLDRIREGVIDELCGLFDATGSVSSRSKLFKDLLNREKKAVTTVGSGIALPHVRTLQAREFVMCFARSIEGLPFRAPDEEPVHLFFGMVAPPYDDRIYIKVYQHLASFLIDPEHVQQFLEAEEPGEVLRLLDIFR